jgi:hypothetical protein
MAGDPGLEPGASGSGEGSRRVEQEVEIVQVIDFSESRLYKQLTVNTVKKRKVSHFVTIRG